jgi:uncharacterized protein (UPF0332 family)
MNDYWAKAMVFARSARLLQQSGDPDSAINRAYYAMYDAARAALESIDPKLSVSKKHDTIIRRFGEHIVVGRQLDKRLSRIFNSGEDSRLFADYARGFVEPDKASRVLDEMDEFLSAVADILSETYP